jgi:CBS domain-containing protein
LKEVSMNVGQLMTQNVRACHPDDTLNTAAQIMWDNDCGCVPVVDADRRVVGMLTDRDICMAAYTQGGSLRMLRVSSAMSEKVYSCKPEDTLAAAEELMREKMIRRLPVTDAQGHLVGIISLNDVAREAEGERARPRKDVTADEVGLTLAAICRPRLPSVIPTAAAA